MGLITDERIKLAREGREYWLKLVEQYSIDASCQVVLIPNSSDQVVTLQYLPSFIKKKNSSKGIVIVENMSLDMIEEFQKASIDIHLATGEAIKALIQFYCLYEFTPNLVVASLEEPTGRKGINMVGKKGLTYDEVFAGVSFGPIYD